MLVAAVELQVRVVEEPCLLRTHAGAYRANAGRVGRFLPGIGTLRTAPPADIYFANCTEARAAGASPLHAGDPGYRSAMDRDGDGVACE